MAYGPRTITRVTTVTLDQGEFTAETELVAERLECTTRARMIRMIMESQDQPATFRRDELDEMPNYVLAVILGVR